MPVNNEIMVEKKKTKNIVGNLPSGKSVPPSMKALICWQEVQLEVGSEGGEVGGR